MRSALLVAALLAVAGAARADDRPRSIWLECKAPPVWPVKTATPVRLTCRVETTGPAFWQTVNPFTVERASEVLDPFAVDVTPRYIDVFETGRYARPRPQRTAHAPTPQARKPEHTEEPPRKLESTDELMSPFEVYPDDVETLNPFEPPRDDADRAR